MHVETDTYCDGCAYNLHGQTVTRDERLGILVCRCPECGKWHAAGRETSAAREWQRRLGVGLLQVWVLLLIAYLGLLLIGIGSCFAGHYTAYTTTYRFDPPPPVADPNGDFVGSADGTVYRTYPSAVPPPAGSSFNYGADPGQTETGSPLPMLLMLGGTAGLSLLFGCAVSSALWHIRPSRARWWVLLPALTPMVFFGLILLQGEVGAFIRGWLCLRAAAYAVWAGGFAFLGLRVGRPVVRGILTIFLPPRPRRIFDFLWTVDGKRPTQSPV